eukprot:scaffold71108_cov35-Attheya_sp.AAC.1
MKFQLYRRFFLAFGGVFVGTLGVGLRGIFRGIRGGIFVRCFGIRRVRLGPRLGPRRGLILEANPLVLQGFGSTAGGIGFLAALGFLGGVGRLLSVRFRGLGL